MPGFLLDTSAISILAPRPGRKKNDPAPAPVFQQWVREHDEELFLSTITLAEIKAGISKLERKGAHSRAAGLSRWMNAILTIYASRTLPLDGPAALETGRLLDRAAGAGAGPGFEDAAIAATASIHDLVVVTANIRHFEPLGVPFLPPPV